LVDRVYDRDYWTSRAKWTLDAADELLNVSKSIFGNPSLNYLKSYIAVTVGGYNYMSLHKRTLNKSLLSCRVEQSFQDEAAGILDGENIAYVRKPKSIRMTVDKEMIERQSDVFKSVALLVKKSWEG